MRRRDILAGTLVSGAAAAVPARLLGQTLVLPAVGVPVTALSALVPATLSSTTPYQQRVLALAAEQRNRVAPRLWRSDLVGIADFAQPSSMPRLHFANLENGTVRSFLVAHGRGSDQEHDGWLKNFSNVPGSEATSRGAFLTCEWYNGKYGTSIRLVGLDDDNSHALDRAIVIHPAWYAAPAMVDKWGKLGRSEGCFAMAPDDFNEALWRLSGGRLLFADRIGSW